MVTGIDIVREQVRVAAGEELSLKQEDVRLTGHAIECRINAEAAHKNFAPAPGPIESYIEPSGPGVRVDSGLEAGSEVTPLYDPMVAKLITWDVDRESATRRMLRALDEYQIEPLTTLIPFHKAVMASEEWAEASTFREKIADKKWLKTLAPEAPAKPAEGEEEEPKSERTYQVEVNGRLHSVKVIGAAAPASGAAKAGGGKRPAKRERKAGGSAASGNDVVSPLQGTMFKVNVEKGQDVEEGAIICVIEAMKMENEIAAHKSGKITALSVAEGQPISSGDPIATIE
jgi:acetyl-CoA/propionyl-CoA carboxylase biotin carboxyl carrier protein